jgi:hypothetical protein
VERDDDPDEKGQPGPKCWGLGVGLPHHPAKSLMVEKLLLIAAGREHVKRQSKIKDVLSLYRSGT